MGNNFGAAYRLRLFFGQILPTNGMLDKGMGLYFMIITTAAKMTSEISVVKISFSFMRGNTGAAPSEPGTTLPASYWERILSGNMVKSITHQMRK
jgi:hypothetical protein